MGEDVFSLLTETGGNRQILILKHFGELPEEPSLWTHYFILECYYLFLLFFFIGYLLCTLAYFSVLFLLKVYIRAHCIIQGTDFFFFF